MATTAPALRTSVSTEGATRRPNHVLRLMTLGFWGGEHRTSVSVDESGNTNIQKLSR
jgi:hypothetical protein